MSSNLPIEWAYKVKACSDLNSQSEKLKFLLINMIIGGSAIAEQMLSNAALSVKLSVTYTKKVGWILICYGQKHSNKPKTKATLIPKEDTPVQFSQTGLQDELEVVNE